MFTWSRRGEWARAGRRRRSTSSSKWLSISRDFGHQGNPCAAGNPLRPGDPASAPAHPRGIGEGSKCFAATSVRTRAFRRRLRTPEGATPRMALALYHPRRARRGLRDHVDGGPAPSLPRRRPLGGRSGGPAARAFFASGILALDCGLQRRENGQTAGLHPAAAWAVRVFPLDARSGGIRDELLHPGGGLRRDPGGRLARRCLGRAPCAREDSGDASGCGCAMRACALCAGGSGHRPPGSQRRAAFSWSAACVRLPCWLRRL